MLELIYGLTRYRTTAQALSEWPEPVRDIWHPTLPRPTDMGGALWGDDWTTVFQVLPDQEVVLLPMPTSRSTELLDLPKALVRAVGNEYFPQSSAYQLTTTKDNEYSYQHGGQLAISTLLALMGLVAAVRDSRAVQDLLAPGEYGPLEAGRRPVRCKDGKRKILLNPSICCPDEHRQTQYSRNLLSVIDFNAAENMTSDVFHAATWLHERRVGARVRIRRGKFSSVDMFYADSLLPVDPASLPMHRAVAFQVFHSAAQGVMTADLVDVPAVPVCAENDYILTSHERGGEEVVGYYSQSISNAENPLTSYTRLALSLAFAKLQARHDARARKDPLDSELPFAED